MIYAKFLRKAPSLALFIGFFLYTALGNAQITTLGTETLVNTSISNSQQNPTIGVADNGNYVVAWEGLSSGISEIYFQRFDSLGNTIGGEMLISSSGFNRYQPDISLDSVGNFVIAFMEFNISSGVGNYNVRFQAFDNTGINTTAVLTVISDLDHQKFPKVSLDNVGKYIVTWQHVEAGSGSTSIEKRAIQLPGTNLESIQTVQTTAGTGYLGYPDVVKVKRTGDYTITWQSANNDGDGLAIVKRSYNDANVAISSDVVVNTFTADNQQDPCIDSDQNGNYYIAWTSYGQDGDGSGIYLQKYDALHNALGAEQKISEINAGSLTEPSIAVSKAGNYAVAWTDDAQDGSNTGVFYKIFTDNQDSIVGQAQLNTRMVDFQQFPALAWKNEMENLIGVWQDGQRCASTTNDGENYGVYAQRLEVNFMSDTIIMDSLVSCNGFMDAGVTVVVSNGTPPYTYLWSNGATTAFISGIGAGTYSVTISDASGFMIEDSIVITEPPVLIAASVVDSSVTCNGFLDGGATASATGGTMPYAYTWSNGAMTSSITGVGAGMYAVTVTDMNGCTSTSSVSITEPPVLVVDFSAPADICIEGGVQTGLSGGTPSGMGGDYSGTGVTDNGNGLTYSFDPPAAGLGPHLITYTYTDSNGCTDSASDSVVVVSIPPTAVCQDITVYLDGTGNATITAADIDDGSNDDCTASLGLSLNISSFTCSNIGANTVTLTVSDNAGNMATCSSTVTVRDTVSPIASCQNITVYLDGAGSASITTADIDNGSTDNCVGVSLSASPTSFTCADIGANTVTLTVDDGNGNTSSCTSTVSVVDTISPVAVCQDITVFLDGAGNATITAADVDGGSTDNCGSLSLGGSPTSFTCADIGANTVTLTVDDGNGNTSSCTSTVSVVDTISPVAVCQDITVFLDGAGNATITATDVDGGSTDNCGSLSLGASQTSFTCAEIGANNVTLTADDGNGNMATCTSTVSVVDTISPVAVCQDITVQLDASGNASITATDIDGGSTDNCGNVSLSIDSTSSSLTCSNIGPNTVILNVEDGNGNVSNCSASVTVQDTVPPVAVCQDITVFLDGAGNATITATDVDGGSTDNCGSLSLGASQTSFTCAEIGANNVTLTADDGNGNMATCTSTVTVLDTISPVPSCQDITVFLDGSGNAIITSGDIDAGSTDNCGSVSLTASPTSFTCTDIGANNVTLTADDGNGNTSSCTSSVTVQDTVPPVAVCQDITVQLDASGNASITASDIDGGSNDNCGNVSLSIDSLSASFTCADIGANNVMLTVGDGNGNVSNCSASVTVQDTVPPVAVCQDITVQLDASGNASITASDIDGGSTDNCGNVSLSIDSLSASFTCADIGANNVMLTVGDGNGNVSNCSASVTVQDTVPPVAVCQDITVYLDVFGNTSITASDIDGGSNDNCGNVSLSIDSLSASFTCIDTGSNTIILMVSDGSGNDSNCSATVTVIDTSFSASVMLSTAAGYCIDANIQNDSLSGGSPIGGVYSGIGVTDLGDGMSFNFDPTVNGVGNVLVTYTYTSGNGCIGEATDSIEVFALPVVTLMSPGDVCSTGGAMTFNGGSPMGGIYSGPGVTDNGNGMDYTFNPDSTGLGMFTITYDYTDSLGCSNSDTTVINVVSPQPVSLTIPPSLDTLCIDAGLQVISNAGSPAGGVYSGPGVTDGGDGISFNFDPAAAGLGLHLITYTGGGACSGMFTDFIHVFDLPIVTFSIPASKDTFCVDASAEVITMSGAPDGGVYSGPGVIDGGDGISFTFDPAIAGVGFHILTYTYTDNIGCSNSFDDFIHVLGLPAVSFTAPSDLCIDAGVQTGLSGGSPAGGTYSGPGVTMDTSGMTYSFDPASAGAGVHIITYTYTDSVGCTGIASDSVEVFALPVVTFTAPADLCIDAGVQSGLSGGSPAGGTYSGPGVTMDTSGMTYSFDPASAGVGEHIITYDYTDANGCSSSASDTVEVFALPVVTFTALADLCIDAGVQTGLSGGSPAGGTYSGPGVTMDTSGMTYSFDPASAGVGEHIITYDYTDANGCSSSASDTVEVFALPVVTFTALADLCIDAGVQSGLSGGSPAGGTYSGPGVTMDTSGMTYSFDPASAGAGEHIITYDYTDANGCSSSASDTVEVFALPVVTFTALADLCIDAGVQSGLSGGSPAGGTYSGPGVTMDTSGMTYSFDPASAGVGEHIITYDYTDANGCSSSASDTVEVFALPVVTFTALADLCIDAGVQSGLSGGSPAGGTYSGPGVTDNGDDTYYFDPAVAGVGVHTITYDYTDANGCTNSASDMVEVFALPVVTFTALADLCIDAGVQAGLSGGSPAGGTYSGPGVTMDTSGMTYSFDPASAGVGEHIITYDYTDANGCSSSASDTVEVFALPVVTFTAPVDLCIDAGVQSGLSGGSPAGGTYSGPGVTMDTSGMTYSFDPAGAGVGEHIITYDYVDMNGCTGTASDTIEVFDLPVVSLVTEPFHCLDADISMLPMTGGIPSGGVYSGAGITDGGNGISYFIDPMVSGLGTVTVTYTYTDPNGCTSSATSDIDIVECGATNSFDIDDPCQCLDNATPIDYNAGTGGDDGQFSELVSITGAGGAALPNGMTWSVVGATGAFDAFNVPAMGVQSAGVAVPEDGSVLLAYNNGIYEIPFVHVDDMGYTLTLEGPFAMGSASNVTLTISNKCWYPNPEFDPSIPDMININDAVITLGGIDGNGNGEDTITFEIDGNPATMLDPMALGLGMHTVEMSYEGVDDGFGGVSPDGGITSASPGCVQEVIQDFEIVDCDLVVDCSNITDTTLACRADLPPVDFTLPIVIDSCGDVINSALTIIPGDSGCPGDTLRITRTYFLQDQDGNMAECMQTFTVISTMDPTFTVFPGDTVLECGAATDPSVTGTAEGEGECNPANPQATVTFSDVTTPGACPAEMVITRTWTLTDRCGRSVDMDQVIMVVDTVAPDMQCMDATAYLDANGMVSISSTDLDNGSSDNCGGPITFSLSTDMFTCDDIGDNEVYLIGEDECGNIDSCLSTVTVLDTISPLAECQNITVFLDANGMASITPDEIDNGSSDNCTLADDLIFILSVTEFDCSDLDAGSTQGSVDVTLSVEDESGNVSTCTATVTVVDNMAPIVSCWGDQEITLTDGACGEYVNYNEPIVMDNCPGFFMYEVISGPSTGDFLTPGVYTVVYRVTNVDRGDFGECEFTITVNGVVDPVASLTCNSYLNISLDENCEAFINADMILEGGNYGCYNDYVIIIDGDTLPSTVALTEVGEYEVTVYDPLSGNSCWGIVNVEDKIAPVVACPCEDYQEVDAGDFTLLGTFEGNTYYVSTSNYFWLDANTAAQAAGGNMLSVNSPQENAFIVDAFGGNDFRVHIGFTDSEALGGMEAGNSQTNGWVWTDGSPITYTNWSGGEPNDAGSGEDYVEMFGNGQWNDIGNTTFNQRFILEIDGICEFTCYEVGTVLNSTENTPNPEANPGSCNDVTGVFSDDLETQECGSSRITRTWIFTDASGNTSSCEQVFVFRNIEIADLLLPPAVVTLGCGADLSPEGIARFFDQDTRRTPILEDDDYTETPDVLENNEGIPFAYPHYIVKGFDGNDHAQPVDNQVCQLIATYSDQLLEACAVGCHGNSKVIREWTLVDWCTTEIVNYTQVIKSIDEEGPTFIAKDTTVSTRPWDCTAEFELPQPWELHDNCDISPVWYVSGPAGVVISGNAADGYIASGAPKGVHTFIYTAEDCCGNQTSVPVTITVRDQVAPVASTKQDIVVALTPAGPGFESSAKIFTYQVDNFSYDACTDVHLEIRRVSGAPACDNLGAVIDQVTGEQYNNNVTFNNQVPILHADDDRNDTDGGAFVKFCCEDVNEAGADVDGDGVLDTGYHEVVLRVWDDANMTGVYGDVDQTGHADNYNETWAYVKVEDNLPPIITCPADATISCYWAIDLSTDFGAGFQDASQANFDKTGSAEAYSTCTVEDIEFSDRLNLDDCGVGTIRRTWRASKDGKNGSQSSQCIQNITVEAAESVFNVTPPNGQPFSNAECNFDVNAIPASQKPSVEGGICDVIGESISVDTFLFEGGVCKKWVVNYNYYNWCTGESMGPIEVIYVYEDTEAPTIECEDVCYSTDANCEYTLALSKSAIDTSGCTDAGWLKWHVSVDTWADGTIDYIMSTYAINPANGRKITQWATNDDLATRYNVPNTVQWIYVEATSSGQAFASTAIPEDLGGKYSKHKVVYKVTDGCHNFSSCEETIEVADKKAPTPYCVSLSTALMADPDGDGPQRPMVELWACDFNVGSFDNCSPEEDLMYTFDNIPFVVDSLVRVGQIFIPVNVDVPHYFNENGFVDWNGNGGLYPVVKASTIAAYNRGEIQKWIPETLCAGKVFTCDDAPQAEIVMSIWDKNLNVDFCNVFLTFGGEVGDCDPTNNRVVSGQVQTEMGSGVEGVEVAIEGPGLEQRIAMTDDLGDYRFSGINKAVDAMVSPFKDGDDDNGVSTLDLVLIQRHILAMAPFTSAYKVIAADVNNTQSITGADVVELRKLILGVTSAYASNDSWRFVDANQSMIEGGEFPFREDVQAPASDLDQMDVNFVAVKIGDVNNSAEVLEGRSGKDIQLTTANKAVNKGEIVEITMSSADYQEMYGYQFTLNMNGLELVDVQGRDLNMTSEHVAVLNNTTMTVSYASSTAETASDLFTLVMRATQSGNVLDMLQITSEVTRAETYVKADKGISVASISLADTREASAYALYQNEPNPFKDQTIIGWNMAESGTATMTIYDVQGRIIHKLTGEYSKGEHMISLDREDLQGVSGVLYYQLESGSYTATKKMILID